MNTYLDKLLGKSTDVTPTQSPVSTPAPDNPFSQLKNTITTQTPIPGSPIPESRPPQSVQTPIKQSEQNPFQHVSAHGTQPVSQSISSPVSDLGKFQFSTQPETASTDATEQFKQLINQLQSQTSIQEIVDNIRRVEKFLLLNPQLKEILMPEDIGVIVSFCRRAYGFAVTKKADNKSKKTKTATLANELSGLMDQIGF